MVHSEEAERQSPRWLESFGPLADGFAHDINNSLGAILNCSTLLARRVDDPDVRVDVETIHEAAAQAVELTRRLLAVVERTASNPELIDIGETATQVTASLRAHVPDRSRLDVSVEDAPLLTIADRSQLETVITALVSNACDAMPAGGTVSIEAARATDVSGSVVVRVRDTGLGMTSEVAARAFEPFFTTKHRGGGRGLGLAAVQGLVHQNNGVVTIDSRPGDGTTVTVMLPANGHDPAEVVARD